MLMVKFEGGNHTHIYIFMTVRNPPPYPPLNLATSMVFWWKAIHDSVTIVFFNLCHEHAPFPWMFGGLYKSAIIIIVVLPCLLAFWLVSSNEDTA